MAPHELLRSNYSIREAEQLQVKYREKVQKEKQSKYYYIQEKEIETVIGVDISYFHTDGKDHGVACAVLWDYKNNTHIDSYFAQSIIKFPYKAGFLGFRENGLIAEAIQKAGTTTDIVLCDGHGIIHPRRFGEAIHLGIALNIASIGVAKNPFIGFYDRERLERKKGNKAPVWARNPVSSPPNRNEILGYAVSLTDKRKPVFVSPGYKTNLDLALDVVLNMAFNHRQPEPLYLADKLSRKRIKNSRN